MNRTFKSGLRLAAAGILAATAAPAIAAPELAFTVEITGSGNVPRVIITNNSPQLEITRFEMTIGDTSKNFDGSTNSPIPPPGGTASQALPIVSGSTNFRSDVAVVVLTNFGPGESFSVDLDIDSDVNGDTVEDYRSVFFNNNTANAQIKLFSGPQSITYTLSDRPQAPWIWKGPLLNLKVQSIAETNGTVFVPSVQVTVDDRTGTPPSVTEFVGQLRTIGVPVGSQVEISAPRQVYKDIHGADITNSVQNDPDKIDLDAEERFTALGISVNNVPQTGDPTL